MGTLEMEGEERALCEGTGRDASALALAEGEGCDSVGATVGEGGGATVTVARSDGAAGAEADAEAEGGGVAEEHADSEWEPEGACEGDPLRACPGTRESLGQQRDAKEEKLADGCVAPAAGGTGESGGAITCR